MKLKKILKSILIVLLCHSMAILLVGIGILCIKGGEPMIFVFLLFAALFWSCCVWDGCIEELRED